MLYVYFQIRRISNRKEVSTELQCFFIKNIFCNKLEKNMLPVFDRILCARSTNALMSKYQHVLHLF